MLWVAFKMTNGNFEYIKTLNDFGVPIEYTVNKNEAYVFDNLSLAWSYLDTGHLIEKFTI